MKLYHTTDHAKTILFEGFMDRSGNYGIGMITAGVWLADRPLDANEGADGNTVLEIEIPAAIIEPYEWIQDDDMGYTESFKHRRRL